MTSQVLEKAYLDFLRERSWVPIKGARDRFVALIIVLRVVHAVRAVAFRTAIVVLAEAVAIQFQALRLLAIAAPWLLWL